MKKVYPLLVSIVNNNMELIQALLSSSTIDVNLCDELTGFTPLMCATQKKTVEIVSLLLKVPGLNINAQDEGGRTALFFAVQSGDVSVTKLLVDAGADSVLGRVESESPLYFAKLGNRKDLVELLEPKGIAKIPVTPLFQQEKKN